MSPTSRLIEVPEVHLDIDDDSLLACARRIRPIVRVTKGEQPRVHFSELLSETSWISFLALPTSDSDDELDLIEKLKCPIDFQPQPGDESLYNLRSCSLGESQLYTPASHGNLIAPSEAHFICHLKRTLKPHIFGKLTAYEPFFDPGPCQYHDGRYLLTFCLYGW